MKKETQCIHGGGYHVVLMDELYGGTHAIPSTELKNQK